MTKDHNQNIDPLQASGSLIVRDLSGKIFFWSSSAEEKYGWSSSEAMGNVTHNFLSTVFPQPLDVINVELLNKGVWKGELIHTRVDGTRVKVKSSWHLYRDVEGVLCTVLEVNDNFFAIKPEDAHLFSPSLIKRSLKRYWTFLSTRKRWWLVPILIVSSIYLALVNWLAPVSQTSEFLNHEDKNEIIDNSLD